MGCDHPRTLQVVGVARDSKIRSMNEVTLPHGYLVMETAGDPGPLMEGVRQTLLSADPDFRTYGVRRLSDALDASFWQSPTIRITRQKIFANACASPRLPPWSGNSLFRRQFEISSLANLADLWGVVRVEW